MWGCQEFSGITFWSLGRSLWSLGMSFWSLDGSFLSLDGSFWSLDGSFWSLDGSFWSLDGSFWSLDQSLWSLDQSFWSLHESFWSHDQSFWSHDQNLWSPGMSLRSPGMSFRSPGISFWYLGIGSMGANSSGHERRTFGVAPCETRFFAFGAPIARPATMRTLVACVAMLLLALPAHAEDPVLPPPPVSPTIADIYDGPVWRPEKPMVTVPAATAKPPVVLHQKQKRSSPATRWLLLLAGKDFQLLTGKLLPEDSQNDPRRIFEAFKKEFRAHEDANAPRSAFLFFADRVTIANGDDTVLGVAQDGSLDRSMKSASIGPPLGWVENGLETGAPLELQITPFPPMDVAGFPDAVKRMVEKANAITAEHQPQAWGGGHDASFSGPYDSSGAVSAVLHAGGALDSARLPEELLLWGDPGPGLVTLYVSPTYVYMSIGGRCFGTSETNPGGGAAWFNGSARPGFVVRHLR